MANPFVRTMRSFHADSYYVSFIGTLAGIFFILIWLIWFFTAKVPVYQTSKDAVISFQTAINSNLQPDFFGIVNRMETSKGKYILSEFPINMKGIIKKGQKALLKLNNSSGNIKSSFPAVVTKVTPNVSQDKLVVELMSLMENKFLKDIRTGTPCTVQIEVKNETPATIFMRISGFLS